MLEHDRDKMSLALMFLLVGGALRCTAKDFRVEAIQREHEHVTLPGRTSENQLIDGKNETTIFIHMERSGLKTDRKLFSPFDEVSKNKSEFPNYSEDTYANSTWNSVISEGNIITALTKGKRDWQVKYETVQPPLSKNGKIQHLAQSREAKLFKWPNHRYQDESPKTFFIENEGNKQNTSEFHNILMLPQHSDTKNPYQLSHFLTSRHILTDLDKNHQSSNASILHEGQNSPSFNQLEQGLDSHQSSNIFNSQQPSDVLTPPLPPLSTYVIPPHESTGIQDTTQISITTILPPIFITSENPRSTIHHHPDSQLSANNQHVEKTDVSTSIIFQHSKPQVANPTQLVTQNKLYPVEKPPHIVLQHIPSREVQQNHQSSLIPPRTFIHKRHQSDNNAFIGGSNSKPTTREDEGREMEHLLSRYFNSIVNGRPVSENISIRKLPVITIPVPVPVPVHVYNSLRRKLATMALASSMQRAQYVPIRQMLVPTLPNLSPLSRIKLPMLQTSLLSNLLSSYINQGVQNSKHYYLADEQNIKGESSLSQPNLEDFYHSVVK